MAAPPRAFTTCHAAHTRGGSGRTSTATIPQLIVNRASCRECIAGKTAMQPDAVDVAIIVLSRAGVKVERYANGNVPRLRPGRHGGRDRPPYAQMTGRSRLLLADNLPMPNQNLSDAKIRQYIKHFKWMDEQPPGSVSSGGAGH